MTWLIRRPKWLPEWNYWPLIPLGALLAVALFGLSIQQTQQYSQPKAQIEANQPLKAPSPEERMAYYAGLLDIFTAALFIIAVFQVWLAFRAEKTARLALEIANRQMLIQGKQTDIIEKQHAIGRLDYLATHRPKLLLRSVMPMLEGVQNPSANPIGQRLMVSYEVANIGGSNAKVISTKMEIKFMKSGRLTMPRPPEVGNFALESHQNIKLSPGETLEQSYGNPEALYDGDMIALQHHSQGLFFCGHILYEDDGNTIRRTSFCRRYDHKLGYWPPSEYYDYETED